MVVKLSVTRAELAADQREQIAGLLERIVPHGEMPVGARHVASRDEIAVGEQHRRLGFVGLDARGVDRHHVRPVEEIGDAAEALGLALRAIGGAGAIEPHQLAYWPSGSMTVSISSSNGRFGGCAMVSRSVVATKFSARQRLAVERERRSLQLLAVEHQRRRRARRVRLELELGAHRGGRADRAKRRDRRFRSSQSGGR